MSGARPLQLITFEVAGSRCACDVGYVTEVVAPGRITRVPGLPEFVLGAMNLRGHALPIIDLAGKVGLAPAVVGRWTTILVVVVPMAEGALSIGVMVDAVSDMLEPMAEEVVPPPSIGTRIHAKYLTGLIRFENTFIPLLDLQLILSREELLSAAGANDEPSEGEHRPDPGAET